MSNLASNCDSGFGARNFRQAGRHDDYHNQLGAEWDG